MTTYTVTAKLLQQIVDVLHSRPAGEVFMLLLTLKEEVDRQNAQKPSEPSAPTLGRQE